MIKNGIKINPKPKFLKKSEKVPFNPEKKGKFTPFIPPPSLKNKENWSISGHLLLCLLKKLMLESGVVSHVWDFYLSIGNREYRIKDYGSSNIIFKKLNYDFIPYSTKYGQLFFNFH